MSNTIINLRIRTWHFQVLRDRPYVRISRNMYHYKNPASPWIAWY